VIGAVILTAALTTFFLSLVRLHHQMVAVKAEELALARELYAEAYAPVRESPTLETLTTQSSALAAAEHSRSVRVRSTTGRSTRELSHASSRSRQASLPSQSGV
jgi:hypothetical protein